MGRMRSVAGQWLFLGDYMPLDQEIGNIMAVTPADVQSLLKQYSFRPRTIVRYGPGRSDA
jgi:predicted Zn-dependent peptidase